MLGMLGGVMFIGVELFSSFRVSNAPEPMLVSTTKSLLVC